MSFFSKKNFLVFSAIALVSVGGYSEEVVVDNTVFLDTILTDNNRDMYADYTENDGGDYAIFSYCTYYSDVGEPGGDKNWTVILKNDFATMWMDNNKPNSVDIVLAFTGTRSYPPTALRDDIEADYLQKILDNYSEIDGSVGKNAGKVGVKTLERWKGLSTNILEEVARRKPNNLFITGHSLGGAMAQVAAIDLKKKVLEFNKKAVVKLETYNAIPVGDDNFRKYLTAEIKAENMDIYRRQGEDPSGLIESIGKLFKLGDFSFGNAKRIKANHTPAMPEFKKNESLDIDDERDLKKLSKDNKVDYLSAFGHDMRLFLSGAQYKAGCPQRPRLAQAEEVI